MDSALRPRDIQARIRAGESPEEVAVAAQTSIDSIMGFATPVLAERAHVARTAQNASVRRRNDSPGPGRAPGRTLGESAGFFFADHSLHDDDVTWDAWRQADGRWALVATYAIEGSSRRAEFSHDLPGKYVVAENDEARLLTGELREPGTPAASSGGSGPADPSNHGRRLSAVHAPDDLPLGDDAIELVRDRVAEVPEAGEQAEEVWSDPVTAAEETATDEEPASTRSADRTLFEDEEPAAEAEATAPIEKAPAKKARAKRKGRSAIPSWDEIMFGDGKPE